MGQFVTLKNNQVQNVIYEKQGAKNRVIVFQKEKRPGCLFSFWITMTLVFANWFLQPIFWTLFLKFETIKKSWHGKLKKWVPIDHSLECLTFEIGVWTFYVEFVQTFWVSTNLMMHGFQDTGFFPGFKNCVTRGPAVLIRVSQTNVVNVQTGKLMLTTSFSG